MVLYSNSASVKARFGQYTDPKEFDGAVDSLPYERGLTRIDKALELTASDIFAQSRSGVPKIAMLITDGTQTAAADAKGLKEASEPLRQAGVRVLAVGVGKGVDREELRLVTESDEDVVVAADFEDLLLKLSNLTSQACRLAGKHHQKSPGGRFTCFSMATTSLTCCLSFSLAPPPCSTPVDLAFIIDSSGSIGRTNYKKQKNFVKEVAKTFGLSPNGSRAAMVLYSNSASVKARFGQYTDPKEFDGAVDSLPYERGLTRIDKALELTASDIFAQSRSGVPKIAMLITDGTQTAAADAKGLKEASEPLRQAGVRVLAVGVGKGVDREELRLVTESDEDVVVAADFEDLLLKLSNLTSQACRLAVAKTFGLSPNGSRAAMVLYSNSASVKARFGQYTDPKEFDGAVDSLPYERGLTRIDKALELTASDIFAQSRSGVPKIAMLITDGTQTAAADAKGLKEASEPLRQAGVRVLAVGVGKGVDREELRLVTESDEDVVVAADFEDLLLKLSNLTSQACRLAGKHHQKSEVAKTFGLSPNGSRAAMVLYSNSASVKARFGQYTDPKEFDGAVDSLPYERGLTRIDKALELTASDIFAQSRSGVPKIAMLITDGTQTAAADAKGLKEASEPLRQAGVRVLAVGVGKGVDREELRLVTESDEDVVVAADFEDLLLKLSNLTSQACRLAGKHHQKSEVAKTFGLSPNGSRAAMVLYSNSASVKARFGQYTDPKEFDGAVDSLPYERGLTRIDKALELTASDIFAQSRSGVPKIAMLITDGTQTAAADAKGLKEASEPLRQAGVRVLAVGVGKGVDREELRLVTESDEDVVVAADFEDLLLKLSNLTSQACRLAGKHHQKSEVAKTFGLSPNGSRAAMVLYSNSASVKARFGQYTDPKEFDGAVDSLPYERGLTRIDKALELTASDIFAQSRSGVPKIAMLITDGTQTAAADAKGLKEASEPLRQAGVRVLAVGVGKGVDREELRLVTESDEDVVVAADFEDLLLKLSNLTSQACRLAAKRRSSCLIPMDIAFLLDSSDAAGKAGFQREKEFFKLMSSALSLSLSGTRVGVISYSAQANLAVALQENTTAQNLRSAIDALQFVGGTPRIEKALESVLTDLFTFDRGTRSGIPKVAVLLTKVSDSIILQYDTLRRAAAPLKTEGVELIAVGVGRDGDLQDLRVLVGSEEYVLGTESFDSLSELVEDVTLLACKAAEPKRIIYPMDAAILVDTSAGISALNFQREKAFVKTLIRSFTISRNLSRVSLLSYGNKTEVTVNFFDQQNREFLTRNVDSLPLLGGPSQINQALEVAASQLFSPSGSSRAAVPRTIVVVTDGRQDLTVGSGGLNETIALLRQNGVKILVVAVGGEDVDEDGLGSLVEEEDHIFTAESFETLAAKLEKVSTVASEIAAPDRCGKVTDIAFIMDASDSVDSQSYRIQKDFVKAIAKSFGLQPGASRAGVILSGKKPTVNINFDDYLQTEDFIEAVDRLPHPRGHAGIDKVLDVALTQLLVNRGGARPGLGKILVLLTANTQNQSLDTKLLDSVTRRLQQLGVALVVIGVGKQVDETLLRPLVTKGENLFLERSFESLMLKARQVAQITCDNAGYSRCRNPVDVAFLVDSSGSLGEEGFREQKDFIKVITNALNVSPSHSKAGVITYSDRASVAIKFSDYQYHAQLVNTLDALPYQGKTTRIDRAIVKASKELMTVEGGRRKDIPGVMVIMTDGRQTQDFDVTPLEQAAAVSEEMGVTTLVLGIGELANVNELRKMTARDGDVFLASSSRALNSFAQPVATRICNAAAPKTCDVPLDVAFLVESSENISPRDYKRIKDFIKEAATYLSRSDNEQQVGVIVFNTEAKISIKFGQYWSEYDFDRAIDDLPLNTGPSQFDTALRVATKLFTAKNGARPGVQKVGIVLTNGKHPAVEELEDLKDAVRPLHQAGVHVIPIGVTSSVDWKKLRSLTVDDKDVIVSHSCDSLSNKINYLFRRICFEAAYKKCDGVADVIFAIHSSGTLSPSEYRKEKELVKRVATTLNISPGRSRVALILYSNFATAALRLDEKITMESFDNLVDSLPHERGVTRIDRALKLARSIFDSETAVARRGVPKVLILFTDSKQTVAQDAFNLVEAARPLLYENDVRILAVGIGNNVDVRELRATTVDEKDVFLSPSLENLLSLSGSLSEAMCEAAKPPICPEAMDVAFLMDASGSVGADNFEKQKEFIKAVAGTLGLKSGLARAGSLVYSDMATVQQSFNSCNGTHSVVEAVDHIPYYGRTTRIDRALSLANTDLFSDAGGVRSYVANTLLLLTDGRQTPAADSISMERAVRPLKEKKVKRIALGIGSQISPDELRKVVDGDEDVVTVDSFDDLISSMHMVSEKLCTSAALKKCPVPVDIAFLLDSSGSIGELNYRKMKDFVKAVANTFIIGSGKTLATLILYGDTATTAIRFSDHANNADFDAAVDVLPYLGGETRIDKALQLASTELLTERSGARVGVAKVVILVTDGRRSRAPDGVELQKAAKPVLSAGVRLFAVGIGTEVDEKELQLIVDRRDDVILVPSYNGLATRVRQLSLATCESSEIEACDNIMDVGFVLDSSGSLSASEFQQVKDFVDLIANSFLKNKVGSRVGLMQYSILPKMNVRFSDELTREQFRSVLDKVRYEGGYTRLDRALKLAAQELFVNEEGSRKDIPRVMVIITDGINTEEPDSVALDTAVAPLKRAGVTVFVVCIGSEKGRDEMYLLTEQNKNLYFVRTYNELSLQLRKVSKDICESGALPGCDRVMDVSFLVDSSESVGLQNLQKLLDFVRRIAKTMRISPRGSHGSLVVFSDNAKVQIKLDDHDNIQEFSNALRDVPYMGQKTRIDKALRVALSGVFNSRAGMRAGVRRVAVLLTEGHQTRTFDAIPLRYAVEPLRRRRVNVFAVGIGNDVRYNELRSVTSSDQNVMLVETFDDLARIGEELSHKMCREQCTQKSDIVFVVDSSGSISRRNFKREKLFVEEVASTFKMGPDQSQIAVISYSESAQVDIKFGEYTNVNDFTAALGAVKHQRKRTRIDLALKLAAEKVFTAEGGARPNVTKVMVILTDGQQTETNDSTPLDEAVRPLLDMNVTIFAVGVGSAIDITELLELVGYKDENLFRAENFDQLARDSVKVATQTFHGNWSAWAEWSDCSASCGGGIQGRRRYCINPPPKNGGRDCSGKGYDVQRCNTQGCPVNGSWTEWSDWGSCSLTCGDGGIKKRIRTCTNPPPANGGLECEGAGEETEACKAGECPVDGKWGEWSDWGVCSRSCGTGIQSRFRDCDNPPPAHGGKQCPGSSKGDAQLQHK
ncbi:unnamed protein product [Pocillopora meandrina]|uniref:VWFA domain-containing protein n=1 Tax=Pocillopora meandrina TaxID=46732 RepID=A0AAU9WSR1_9CNID|nr:unnamed protein product [Pocillopora meandrina]